MSDLIERLRDKARLRAAHGLTGWVLAEEALLAQAADEIERLTAALRAQPGPVSMDDVEWAGKAHLQDAQQEIADLKHDIAEYIKITSAQAQEIATLTAERNALRDDNAKLNGWMEEEAQAAGRLQRKLNAAEEEIERLTDENGRLRADLLAGRNVVNAGLTIHTLTAERDDLRRQLAKAERDAVRYRWLRNEANTARKCDPMVCIYPLDEQDLIDGDRLDVAIDAARSKE